MSLKNYKKDTLVGNWFEERAKPLKGVVPNYAGFGENTWKTTSSTSFSTLQSSSSSSSSMRKKRGRRTNRTTLMTEGYLKKNVDGIVRSAPSDDWSRHIPKHETKNAKGTWSTTCKSAYSTSSEINETNTEPAKTENEGPAGAPSRRKEKPQRRADACGEVVRRGKDPQDNTYAQRSWLPAYDPGLRAGNIRPSERPSASHMSLSIGNNSTSRDSNARKVTSITRAPGSLATSSSIWRDA